LYNDENQVVTQFTLTYYHSIILCYWKGAICKIYNTMEGRKIVSKKASI